jgi:hypothetical protein
MTYRTALLAGAAYLALGAGTALAQNISTVNQVGTGNGALIDQADVYDDLATAISSPATNAYSNVEQLGSYGSVQVYQGGSGDQNNGFDVDDPSSTDSPGIRQLSGSVAASATLTQDGTGVNYSFITQDTGNNAVANVIQESFGSAYNYSSIYQANNDGSDAQNAKVTQGADGAPVQGNFASVYQVQSSALPGEDAEIYQYGDFNGASIYQASNDSYALIYQFGDGNSSNISQYSGANNTAYSYQYSNSNYSGISQGGSNNYASVWQYNSNGNFSTISQSGDYNGASVLQGAPLASSSSVSQTGTSNGAYVQQTVTGGTSNITQNGSGNYTQVYQ